MPEIGIVACILRAPRVRAGKVRTFIKNKLRAGCYEHLHDHLALANRASLAIEPGHLYADEASLEAAELRAADPQGRGNAVGVIVVEAPGRAVGGLLDLLDTDQVAWCQIIHELDTQAFRFLISFFVFQ